MNIFKIFSCKRRMARKRSRLNIHTRTLQLQHTHGIVYIENLSPEYLLCPSLPINLTCPLFVSAHLKDVARGCEYSNITVTSKLFVRMTLFATNAVGNKSLYNILYGTFITIISLLEIKFCLYGVAKIILFNMGSLYSNLVQIIKKKNSLYHILYI